MREGSGGEWLAANPTRGGVGGVARGGLGGGGAGRGGWLGGVPGGGPERPGVRNVQIAHLRLESHYPPRKNPPICLIISGPHPPQNRVFYPSPQHPLVCQKTEGMSKPSRNINKYNFLFSKFSFFIFINSFFLTFLYFVFACDLLIIFVVETGIDFGEWVF